MLSGKAEEVQKDTGRTVFDIRNPVLLSKGYFYIRDIPNIGLCAIIRVGSSYEIHCSLTTENSSNNFYSYRFEFIIDAYMSFYEWDGLSELDGNWLEKVQDGVVHSNPNLSVIKKKNLFDKIREAA